MGAIIWFIVALVLGGLELLVGEFTLLMLAGGALAGAGVALTGAPLWASTVAFALVSVGLLVFLRPALKKRLHKPMLLDTSPKALIGNQAEVIEPVDGGTGQVRLDGSIWSARSMDPSHTFTVGERVTVVSIDGSTAVVWKEP
ncbi:NfeD family protein [Corynebacterium halotolerans]|uniref:NfeD family protein n=1 Tax=Corynebacterium halotolerans TaxID=225326 RepID=UPI003CE779F9